MGTIGKTAGSYGTGSLTYWEQADVIRQSAKGHATMEQVHLHTRSRQMPQDHQQEDMQPWNRFTYSLRAGKCHKTIRRKTCSHETGSLTYWAQANATRTSARQPVNVEQVYLHTKSRQMPQDHEQEDLLPWNWFTYSLEAGKCHKTMSKRTCSHDIGSLTSWEQANSTRPSVRELAAIKHVHLLSESRNMPQYHQQEDQQAWNRFTYFLRLVKCDKTISKMTYSHGADSLTYWQQENETRPSARKPAAMKQVHSLPECRKMPQAH